jgi:hypothetical protein
MIKLGHTTLGTTPLDVWPSRRRELYLKTHNIHNRQASTPAAVFEPTIPASERPQTRALDRAATGIGSYSYLRAKYFHVNLPTYSCFRKACITNFNMWMSNYVNRLTNGSDVDMRELLRKCHIVQKSVKCLHRTQTSATRQPIGYHRWHNLCITLQTFLFYSQYWHHETHFSTPWRSFLYILQVYISVNPLTSEINHPPPRATLPDEIFTGDFASWTVNFVNVCMKNQQMQQLFIQFINYVW